MRRLLVWTLAAGTVLLAGGQQAMAKEGHEDPREGATAVVSRVPDNLKPGQVWTATITYLKDGRVVADGFAPSRLVDGFAPIVTLRNLGTGEVTIGWSVPVPPKAPPQACSCELAADETTTEARGRAP